MSAVAQVNEPLFSSYSLAPDIRSSEESIRHIANLVCRFGGSASNILLDPQCQLFESPAIRGLIGFKRYRRCAMTMGDPVCAPEDSIPLVDAFRSHCRERGWHCAHAVVGSRIASHFRAQNNGLIEFGVEQVLNLSQDADSPGYIRDLRKKLKRARHAGLSVYEYRPETGRDAMVEAQMVDVVRIWLGSRKGPQTYWSTIDLFRARGITRWFCGMLGEKVVGVLSMLKLQGREGYLLEHILWRPDAPVGTSELLITQAAEALAAEGCGYASFGPAPAAELGEVSGFSPLTQRACRSIYRGCCRLFHLDSKVLYRQKFRPASAEPLYLAFDSPTIRIDTLLALSRTFNFSSG